MLFGFACFGRDSPNNPRLFRALGVHSAEGVKIDSMDYILIKTTEVKRIESIIATLQTFGLRPVRLTKDAPEILATETCTRQQRQLFFRHIKQNRLRYHRGANFFTPIVSTRLISTGSSRGTQYAQRSGARCFDDYYSIVLSLNETGYTVDKVQGR